MPPTSDRLALEEARAAALNTMEIAGGKLHGEDDIVFSGTRFVLPEIVSLEESIQFLTERYNDERKVTKFSRTFNYRPFDGARATSRVIRERFGFHTGKTTYSFFGRNLPSFEDIEVGLGKREQIIWGALQIPGWEDTVVHLGYTTDQELGQVFQVTVEGPRRYRWAIQGFFNYIGEELASNSMYRGQAIDGQAKFLDTTVVDPDDVIFADSLMRRIRGDIWRFIQHTDLLLKRGMSAKYAVLLEGKYGTGKSLLGLLTAQVAIEHGWTFFMCQPGRDNLIDVLQMARMYQPAVVFAEDVDAVAHAAAENIEAHLDVLDGIKTKGLRLMLMLTTNHADLIHKGMLRPGRIGAVISFGAMDREGVERLTRRVIGPELDDDVDFDAVFAAMDGYMPAFVHEALNRAVRYSVDDELGVVQPINTEALITAADALRDQYAMMEGASDRATVPSIDGAVAAAVRATVTEVLEHTQVCDQDDGYHRFDLVPTTNGD